MLSFGCADGDKENNLNLTLRVGPGARDIPLKYQWWHEGGRKGPEARILYDSGDFYIPSEKALGGDCCKTKVPTLQHAAFNKTFIHANVKNNKTPDGHPVVYLGAEAEEPAGEESASESESESESAPAKCARQPEPAPSTHSTPPAAATDFANTVLSTALPLAWQAQESGAVEE